MKPATYLLLWKDPVILSNITDHKGIPQVEGFQTLHKMDPIKMFDYLFVQFDLS